MNRHFTATAFIIDSRHRTLLLWHKRLGRWMPPGGHIDPNETPEEAARRECKEETVLDVQIIGETQEDMFATCRQEGRMLIRPFAIFLEHIPACPERSEPAHEHMDFIFLARPINEEQQVQLLEREATEFRWFDRSAIERLNVETEIFGNVKNYLLKRF
jgi:8-oxo-dGTP pyrophosphatase MutT (NUDIX family)